MPSYTIYAEMACGGCSGAITRLLSKLDGVTEVKCDIVRIFSLDFTLTSLHNKLENHTTFMYTYIYPLFLVTRSLIHKLTQAIIHTYLNITGREYRRRRNLKGFRWSTTVSG